MISKENNYAYIDGANLYRGVEGFGWKNDQKRILQIQKEKAPDGDETP